MKKLFFILALSVCLVGCGHKEAKEIPSESVILDMEYKDGTVYVYQNIIYEYINGEWICRVEGTNLTPEEYVECLDKIFIND